jgi:murein DD-endopeptidase MepM/ murein hydrolase activator NlpD
MRLRSTHIAVAVIAAVACISVGAWSAAFLAAQEPPAPPPAAGAPALPSVPVLPEAPERGAGGPGGVVGDAAAAAKDLGRRYTEWFYAGEMDRLWQRFSPEMRKLFASAEQVRAFRQQVLVQVGQEQEVLDERVTSEGGNQIYVRTARFSGTPQPIVVTWGLAGDGAILGFSVRPQPHEAGSDYLSYRTKTPLHLPFHDAWTVFWGGRTLADNYHAMARDQRFAYDFVVRREGTTHAGDGSANSQYFCYGQPILAPGPGKVVEAVDGIADNRPSEMNAHQPLGNHVVIDHGNGEFSFLAHLQPGSVAVRAGAAVKTGDTLGRCGNSGNSSEPHLHYHLQTTPRFADGAGLPAQFLDYRDDGKPVARGEPMRGHVIEAR